MFSRFATLLEMSKSDLQEIIKTHKIKIAKKSSAAALITAILSFEGKSINKKAAYYNLKKKTMLKILKKQKKSLFKILKDDKMDKNVKPSDKRFKLVKLLITYESYVITPANKKIIKQIKKHEKKRLKKQRLLRDTMSYIINYAHGAAEMESKTVIGEKELNDGKKYIDDEDYLLYDFDKIHRVIEKKGDKIDKIIADFSNYKKHKLDNVFKHFSKFWKVYNSQ